MSARQEIYREIAKESKRGVKAEVLMERYPDMVHHIKKMRSWVPPRKEPAKVLFLYGKSGCGKTQNILEALRVVTSGGMVMTNRM